MRLAYLLHDLVTVEKYQHGAKNLPAFGKKTRRLIHDAIRLCKQDDSSPVEFAPPRARLDIHLQQLIGAPWQDFQTKRLIKALCRH